MKQLFLLASTFLILISTAIGADYYWIGGEANWSDSSHWVTTSGGLITHSQVSTANDDVYFDTNSFRFSDNFCALEQMTPRKSLLPLGAFLLKQSFPAKIVRERSLIGAGQMVMANNENIALEIVVLSPWWKTWWAYSLYFIVVLSFLAVANLYQRRRWKVETQLRVEQERVNRLEELGQFKSRFYTNITHEFRTSLTVIKGMSDQIIGNEKAKMMIQRNSEQILNMINQLLDISKLESNTVTVNWVQGNIIPLLQYLTESCHYLAENKNLNLAFFSKEESLIMDFDKNKIQQILINLISNAIKFTPEYGSVKVIVSKMIENESPFLELTVKDTGKGISAKDLPHIFDRFYQIDNATIRQSEGSGIGLALVKELVELLSGRIEVNSELSKGTLFKVILPIHQKYAVGKQAATFFDKITINRSSDISTAFSPLQTFKNGEKPLVLIIEDNADVREYIISCLDQDYNLIATHNGKKGLEKANESIPDVILCDIMMPEMDGFEVCQKLKTDECTSHIPIILLTAKATQEDKITGLSHGADVYITKPFDKEELLIRLANLVAQSKGLADLLKGQIESKGMLRVPKNREAAFLKKLNNIIETNLHDEIFNTNYLCKAMAMSRTQLHRKLKALTGYSTADYIRSARLKKAKSLLETTNLAIGEIALQVGFKDFSHFSRSYSKLFGATPSETRN